MNRFFDDDKVVISKDQVSCKMGNEVVILNMADGEYFELNYVGSRVWEMIQQPCRLSDIEAALLERFDVERNVLRPDIEALIQNFVEKGLARIEK
jgi:hypothetical protein